MIWQIPGKMERSGGMICERTPAFMYVEKFDWFGRIYASSETLTNAKTETLRGVPRLPIIIPPVWPGLKARQTVFQRTWAICLIWAVFSLTVGVIS